MMERAGAFGRLVTRGEYETLWIFDFGLAGLDDLARLRRNVVILFANSSNVHICRTNSIYVRYTDSIHVPIWHTSSAYAHARYSAAAHEDSCHCDDTADSAAPQ